jgi:hypothetical protein
MIAFALRGPFRFMKKPIVWFAIILIAAGGGAFYFWKERSEPGGAARAVAAEKPAMRKQSRRRRVLSPRSLIRAGSAAQATGERSANAAALDDERRAGARSLAAPLGRQALNDIVITKGHRAQNRCHIDNLPRKKLAERLLPVKPPWASSSPAVRAKSSTLSAQLCALQSYVKLAQAVDAKQLVTLYVELYPLFNRPTSSSAIRRSNSMIASSKPSMICSPHRPCHSRSSSCGRKFCTSSGSCA